MATHIRKLFLPYGSSKWKDSSVVVITGASSGIGRELALLYAKRDCKLVLAARSLERLEKVAEECRSQGTSCTVQVVVTDVTRETDCQQLMETAASTFGCLDVLILNAGVGAHNIFEQTDDLSIYRKLMDVNFFGYLYCAKYALPFLRKTQGQIVVVSSLSGEIGLPLRTAYCASKFAVTGFFEALRTELETSNKMFDMNGYAVHLTIVCPPSVDTNLRKNALASLLTVEADPDHSMPAKECAEIILDAADRKLRKIFFPLKAYLGVYLRPFVPDLIDRLAKKKSGYVRYEQSRL